MRQQGQNRQTKIMDNRTMANMMKQKTRGEEWSKARKRLIEEARKIKPNFIKDIGQIQQSKKRRRY